MLIRQSQIENLPEDLAALEGRANANIALATARTVYVVPMQQIDGTQTSFALPSAMAAGSEEVSLRGVEQGAGTDYTINQTGGQITFAEAPHVGDIVIVEYRPLGADPTAPAGTATAQLATTAFVLQEIANLPTGGGGTPAGNNGQVQFNDNGAFGADAALCWDAAAKRLGLGETAPQARLHVAEVTAPLAASTNLSYTINYGVSKGGYPNNGRQFNVRVYAYQEIVGVKYFSADCLTLNAPAADNGANDDGYTVTWTWDAVSGADGYRVVVYDTSHPYNYGHYKDVMTNTITDSDSLAVTALAGSPTPVGVPQLTAYVGGLTGIGTLDPQALLHVAGHLLAQNITGERIVGDTLSLGLSDLSDAPIATLRIRYSGLGQTLRVEDATGEPQMTLSYDGRLTLTNLGGNFGAHLKVEDTVNINSVRDYKGIHNIATISGSTGTLYDTHGVRAEVTVATDYATGVTAVRGRATNNNSYNAAHGFGAGTTRGGAFDAWHEPTGMPSGAGGTVIGLSGTARSLTSCQGVTGASVGGAASGTGTIAYLTGLSVGAEASGTTSVSTMHGIECNVGHQSSQPATMILGLNLQVNLLSSAGVANFYGIKLTRQNFANVTNGYGIYAEFGNNTFINHSASAVGIIVQGAASQTANLTNWKNSSGAVLTAIDKDGKLGVFAGLADAVNLAVGTSTGTKLGTATSQKLGFWGKTPVIQQVTSTYTADAESNAYSGVDNLQTGSVYAQVADVNNLRLAYENLRASYEDLLTKLKNTGVVA